MDVLFFLKERLRFIRYYYDSGRVPFDETIRKITTGVPPFEPPYADGSESGPPFELEYDDAQTGLEIVGRVGVSMLASSLNLYFVTWERELGVKWEAKERRKAFQNGGTRGYLEAMDSFLTLPWATCEVDFTIIDQVTLARNRDQHPDEITTMRVSYSDSDRKKSSNLFFLSEEERTFFSRDESPSFMKPSVQVTRDTLFRAVDEVEKLGGWLEEPFFKVKYRKRR